MVFLAHLEWFSVCKNEGYIMVGRDHPNAKLYSVMKHGPMYVPGYNDHVRKYVVP